MNPNFIDQELYKEYKMMFEGHDEAWSFLYAACEFYEAVDDQVDEITTINTTKRLTSLAAIYYNHNYWKKYGQALFLVDRISHCQYFDSVIWEHSGEEWQKRDAKALSHAAVNMVFAVILIEFGQATLDAFSLKFREHAHKLHLKDIGL
jgi:hypothetical protein